MAYMLNLNISQPTFDPLTQSFSVTGQASDKGRPEPVSIDSVSVQVDDGSPFPATLTPIRDLVRTVVKFNATVPIIGGHDPHIITVTAKNEFGVSVNQTVEVFTGVIPAVGTVPAVLLEISPATFDPGDPQNKGQHNLLVSQIQQALTPLAIPLASVGSTLAGPNMVLATNAKGIRVLRIGLWIVDATFPVVAPRLPDFPLPLLEDATATAGFNMVPLLNLPESEGLGVAFGFFIPTTTLQQILDAAFPRLRAQAAEKSVSLESVTVTCNAPGSVLASFFGEGGFPRAEITGTITENLGIRNVPGVQPEQWVPAILGHASASSSNVLSEVLWGLIFPPFLAESLYITNATPGGVGEAAGLANGIATTLVGGIPPSIPLSSEELKSNDFSLGLDFPMMLLNWGFFGVSNFEGGGMAGNGTISIAERDQTMVTITLEGPTRIGGYQADLKGGTDQTYIVTLANLVPDLITWQISGDTTYGGAISPSPWSQRCGFVATFPLPLDVKPGLYHFTLDVTATETSGLGSNQILTASSSTNVTVTVERNPKVQP
jgi:hypothetical protein